jgi:hypothetical protein
VAENIAIGAETAEIVVDGWLKSPGHCVNIMSPDYTEMGIAYVTDPKSKPGIYWSRCLQGPDNRSNQPPLKILPLPSVRSIRTLPFLRISVSVLRERIFMMDPATSSDEEKSTVALLLPDWIATLLIL